MTRNEIISQAAQYTWYHRIDLGDGVFTDSSCEPLPVFRAVWDFIRENMRRVDYRGKRVLDVGCRDGMYSFEAERCGAREVVAIDNNISKGAVNLLIPHFQSKVKMQEMNLLELSPAAHGEFDVILFFGVLYHLRYPFWALAKLLDCLKEGGDLLIESGMLVSPGWSNEPLLYCPSVDSPYEPTSCTFFNARGLQVALESMNCTHVGEATLDGTQMKAGGGSKAVVQRQFFHFRKNPTQERDQTLQSYWNETHRLHDVDE